MAELHLNEKARITSTAHNGAESVLLQIAIGPKDLAVRMDRTQTRILREHLLDCLDDAPPTCHGPGPCPHPTFRFGLCKGHFSMFQHDEPLTPLNAATNAVEEFELSRFDGPSTAHLVEEPDGTWTGYGTLEGYEFTVNTTNSNATSAALAEATNELRSHLRAAVADQALFLNHHLSYTITQVAEELDISSSMASKLIKEATRVRNMNTMDLDEPMSVQEMSLLSGRNFNDIYTAIIRRELTPAGGKYGRWRVKKGDFLATMEEPRQPEPEQLKPAPVENKAPAWEDPRACLVDGCTNTRLNSRGLCKDHRRLNDLPYSVQRQVLDALVK